jgi:hypothetical protein
MESLLMIADSGSDNIRDEIFLGNQLVCDWFTA